MQNGWIENKIFGIIASVQMSETEVKNMLALIYSVIVIIVLGFLYKKMIDWEAPLKITKAQAIVPIVLGVLSLPLSFIIFMLIAALCRNVLGLSIGDGPLLLAGFTEALFTAALNEELAKLIFTLISIIIFRKKIKNVYDYILIGGAVGFGFTIVEEFIYTSGIVTLIIRTLTITVHMMLGFAMGRHLGLARYNKVTGKGSVWKEYLLAFLVPVAVHTIYDTLSTNKFLSVKVEAIVIIGIIMSLTALVLTFTLQVFVFKRLKKNVGTLTALSVLKNETEGA